MPSHKLHIEYSRKAGITDEVVLRNVNDMIDFPRCYHKYRKFRIDCGKPIEYGDKFNNDLARTYPEDAELDVKFLFSQTEDFCVAYFLHHFLDLYNDKTRYSKNATLGEKRSWVRNKMNKIFLYSFTGKNLITGRMRDCYIRAENFFKGPKSQYWLYNNIDWPKERGWGKK